MAQDVGGRLAQHRGEHLIGRGGQRRAESTGADLDPGGLLDKLSLSICPIVVGSGMRLFEDATSQVRLTVAESKTFSTGAVGVTYQPETA